MPMYNELVKKYTKRKKDTFMDSVTAGLSYADNVAVDLGLLDDSGISILAMREAQRKYAPRDAAADTASLLHDWIYSQEH